MHALYHIAETKMRFGEINIQVMYVKTFEYQKAKPYIAGNQQNLFYSFIMYKIATCADITGNIARNVNMTNFI